MNRVVAALALLAPLVSTGPGCAGKPVTEPAPEPALPPLPAEVLSEPGTPGVPARLPEGPPLSLRAVDADVRSLLVAIADAAGLSLVLEPPVGGRVSVSLHDVSPRAALDAVLEAAGLSAAHSPRPPWGPAVFYLPRVNVDSVAVGMIVQRFGASPRLARWLVDLRGR